MKAIFIDPQDKCVKEIDYSGNWKDISKLLKCHLFTTVRLSPTETLFVDDEGLLRNDLVSQPFFAIEGYPDPLVGYGLILGNDHAGNERDTEFDVDTVFNKLRFLSCYEIIRDIGREDAA